MSFATHMRHTAHPQHSDQLEDQSPEVSRQDYRLPLFNANIRLTLVITVSLEEKVEK